MQLSHGGPLFDRLSRTGEIFHVPVVCENNQYLKCKQANFLKLINPKILKCFNMMGKEYIRSIPYEKLS